MLNGYIKVAAATPRTKVADTAYNQAEITRITHEADAAGVKIVVFPELSVTSSTCGDLFFSRTLINSAKNALLDHLAATSELEIISIVGVPIVHGSKLYSCAAICKSGSLLALIPKSVVTDTRFAPAPEYCDFMDFYGDSVPFGAKLIFICNQIPLLKLGVEIGEDVLTPCPPSSTLCAAGATVIANLSAISEKIGRGEYVERSVSVQSERCACGYVMSNASVGESTTDAVFSGRAAIYENGKALEIRAPFTAEFEELTVSEIDLDVLIHERITSPTVSEADANSYLPITFDLYPEETTLTRAIDAHPFVPLDPEELDRRAELILSMQAQGLKKRIECSHSKKCILGSSGGLDSCLAILVSARAMDLLDRPRTDIISITMPCFGTTARTKSNAEILSLALGTSFREINISSSVSSHFADISHDPNLKNIVFENAQARERTQVLMDVANAEYGLVVGTGDLSELALGWATYNGDHMSMYGVNAGLPKTLIRHIVSYCARKAKQNGDTKLADVLLDILDTPVSPELLPADQNGKIAQKTEDIVGPYELHDFYLYYMLRYGFSPKKLFRIAKVAFNGVYADDELLRWLENFVKRFIYQQFKRSCLPDGAAIGSVSLSPRAGFRMPSDAVASAWLDEIEQLRA